MIYTAGELAKKLGVSARTVRFYDEKKLLAPQGYSEAGYRLYNDESAERLQKILMLRFMDFTIEQIAEMMYEEPFDLKKSLEEQEQLLLKKKEHVERVLGAVRGTLASLAAWQLSEAPQTPPAPADGEKKLDESENTAANRPSWPHAANTAGQPVPVFAESSAGQHASASGPAEQPAMASAETPTGQHASATDPAGHPALASAESPAGQFFWDNMRRTIELSRQWEYTVTQYRSSDNLNRRIAIHDYSTSPVGFYQWMLGKIGLAPAMKILDLGCGTAAFWLSIAGMLPENLEIHLVDYSAGMLASAEKNVQEIQKKFPEKRLRFILDRRDATDFSYPVSGFDRIMANHVLFHLSREARMGLYPKLNAMLKENGRFTCSLIGRTHLLELHELLRKHYPELAIPSASFDLWLEDAAQELNCHFTVLETEEQKNDLLVPDPEPVFHYVSSYSSQAKEILAEDRDGFFQLIREAMNQDGLFYIHKSTGVVLCEKK